MLSASETHKLKASPLAYAVLFALGFTWGSSFLLVKLAQRDMSPEVLVVIRTSSAAATLLAIAWATKRSVLTRESRKHIRDLGVMAVIYTAIPWTLLGIGETLVTSGLASILTATTSLWTAVFAFFVIPTERPSRISYLGVMLGLAGTILLVGPDLASHTVSSSLGAIVLVIGAMFNSVSYIYQRRRLAGVDPVSSTFWQMIFATAVMALPALPTVESIRFGAVSIAAALALGVLASGLGGIAIFWLLDAVGATRASTVNFLLPVTAVVWGATILGEHLTTAMLSGMAVIFAGILLTTHRRRA